MGRDDLVASAAYQPEPTAAAAARRFVRDTLHAWVVSGGGAGGSGLVDDAVLLTSELVTNAVVHAGTPVQVTCKLADGEVEVVVSDHYPARLVPEPAGSEHGAAERTGGRGLLLPAALASAWGVTYGRAAKSVWFRLGLPGVTGPPGRGGAPGAGLVTGLGGHPGQDLAGGTSLTAAFRPRPPEDDMTPGGQGDLEFQTALRRAARAARAAVGADGCCVLMADEDGDLRLRAADGSVPPAGAVEDAGPAGGRVGFPPAPSLLTVPLIVDGRITGLLAAVSGRPGGFSEAEAVTLQRLADTCAPRLQRAWLDELHRIRRGRIEALGRARGLLAGGLSRKEIMSVAGGAAVPGLASWCAVLLPEEGAALRPAHVLHRDAAHTAALARLLGRACEAAPPHPPPGQPPHPGAGWRWDLPAAASGAAPPGGSSGESAPPGGSSGESAPPGETDAGAPPGVPMRAGIPPLAWCFPMGQPGEGQGVLVIGGGRGDRLPREVAALAGDLACRIGLALARNAGLMPAPQS